MCWLPPLVAVARILGEPSKILTAGNPVKFGGRWKRVT